MRWLRVWNFYIRKIFKFSPKTIKQLFVRSGLFGLLFVFILVALKQSHLHHALLLGFGFSFAAMFLFQLILHVTRNYLDASHKRENAIQIVAQYNSRKKDYQQIRKILNEI